MSRILVGSRRGTPPPPPPPSASHHHQHHHHHHHQQQQHCYSEESGEEESNCPLCIQTMDASDCRFKPCPCGYQICRFCWHRIREEGNERCPACRRIYTDEDVEFLPPGEEKPRKKKSSSSGRPPAASTLAPVAPASAAATTPAAPAGVLPSRRHLVDIRVIQKNLVYVIGISARIAHEPILSEPQYFGQFGKILKIVVNRKNTGAPLPAEKMAAGSGAATTTSGSAYVTFARAEEAGRAIAHVDGSVFDGRVLRATYGTTKYCSYFLRGINCPNAGCMYLHEEGDTSDSYTKEELSSGKMHLHSSLVDRAEGAALRQFGTLMCRPLPPPPHPPPPARVVSPLPTNVATVIINHEQLGQDLVRPASAPPRGTVAGEAAAAVVGSPPSGTHESSRSPPINLAQCEDDAMTFLSRLSRWNASSDILDQAGGGGNVSSTARPHSALASSASTSASASYFDPFAEAKPASPKISSTWLASLALRPPPSTTAAAEAPTGRALPTLSAKGPLLGFDWSPVLQNKGDLAPPPPVIANGGGKNYHPPSGPARSASSPIVTFRNHVGGILPENTMPPAQLTWASSTAAAAAAGAKPAPVGSPAGFAPLAMGGGGFPSVAAATTATPFRSTGTHPHLEQLFASGSLGPSSRQPSTLPPSSAMTTAGGTGSSSIGTRRVLDASQLEQQFFRQAQPPLNVSLAANEILSASPVIAMARSVGDHQHHQQLAAATATAPPAHGIDSPLSSTPAIATLSTKGEEGGQSQGVSGESFRSTVPPSTATAAVAGKGGGKGAKIGAKAVVASPPPPSSSSEMETNPPVTERGKKKVAPPPPVALARIKELALAKEIAAAASAKPSSPAAALSREKSLVGSGPSTKAAPLIPEGDSNAEGEANGSRTVKLEASQQLDPRATAAAPLDSHGRLAASGAGTPSQTEESASSEGTGVLSISVSKKRAKSSRKEATTVTPSLPAALPIHRPAPALPSQPSYLPAWPETANGYAPSPIPNYSIMTETERTSWRQWLQDECKTSKAEEALLRAKVSKIHAEICSWINTYAHSI